VRASLEIPASAWRAVTVDGSRLMATLVVNGLPLHLEAIEVEVDESRIQRASDESDDSLELVHMAAGADGHWQTLEIDGREYVLMATPFC
jgi:hypothetical protein